MNVLLMPVGQNAVCVFKAVFVCCHDGALTGLKNNVIFESEFFNPAVYVFRFLGGRDIVFPQFSHNGINILVIKKSLFLRLLGGGNSLLSPVNGNLFNILEILFALVHAILEQVID